MYGTPNLVGAHWKLFKRADLSGYTLMQRETRQPLLHIQPAGQSRQDEETCLRLVQSAGELLLLTQQMTYLLEVAAIAPTEMKHILPLTDKARELINYVQGPVAAKVEEPDDQGFSDSVFAMLSTPARLE